MTAAADRDRESDKVIGESEKARRNLLDEAERLQRTIAALQAKINRRSHSNGWFVPLYPH